jgi:dipeptidyl aminopeptidase/acylaminoacyl peptidase
VTGVQTCALPISWARDNIGWDFSGWTQFFATRGYAVLQPQYRGSNGSGHSLWLAGDGE